MDPTKKHLKKTENPTLGPKPRVGRKPREEKERTPKKINPETTIQKMSDWLEKQDNDIPIPIPDIQLEDQPKKSKIKSKYPPELDNNQNPETQSNKKLPKEHLPKQTPEEQIKPPDNQKTIQETAPPQKTIPETAPLQKPEPPQLDPPKIPPQPTEGTEPSPVPKGGQYPELNRYLQEEQNIMQEPATSYKKWMDKKLETTIFVGTGSKNACKQLGKMKGHIAYAQITNAKTGGRQFVSFKNWETCWEKYNEKNKNKRYLYEIINSDRPCKPHLDIEWLVDPKSKIDTTKFLKKLCEDIKKLFKERYTREIKESEIKITSSGDGIKYSFHVVITTNPKTIVFSTNRKNVANTAYDFYKGLIELDEYYKDKIDGSIYSTDRELRCIYSTKYGQKRPFQPEEQDEINYLDYIVTHYDPSSELDYITTEYTAPEIIKYKDVKEIKAYRCATLTKLMKEENTWLMDRIYESAQNIHPSSYYTGRTSDGGYRFSYTDRTEPCYTSPERTHKSNGFGIYLDGKTSNLMIFCYSEKCRKLLRLCHIIDEINWTKNAVLTDVKYLTYKPQIEMTEYLDGSDNTPTLTLNKFLKSKIPLIISSPMGTGKTKVLMELIKTNFMEKSILYLSHRQTFSQAISGELVEYKMHNYMEDMQELYKHKKIVIQLDSLPKLCDEEGYYKTYDLVIMDESVSLLNHLSSETLTKTRDLVCKLLRGYIKGCGWLIALDADMDDRVYDYIKSVRSQEPLVLINKHKPETPRTYILTSNYEKQVTKICEDAKMGKKIVLVCMSLQKASELESILSKVIDREKIICHTSMSNDIIKKSLQNVNKLWTVYQIVIYTSVIEAGIDFNVPEYFDTMYCFISLGSTTPRSFMQMTGRIRSLKDNTISVYYEKQMSHTSENAYIPYLAEIERHIATNMNSGKIDITYLPDGTMKRSQTYDELTRLFAENYLENYKKQYYFLGTLIKIIKSKGHICKYENSKDHPPEEEVKTNNEGYENSEGSIENECVIKFDNDLLENHDTSTNISKVSVEYYKQELLNAETVTNITPYLKLKNKNCADTKTKAIIDRYEMTKKFKITEEEFTKEFLDAWLYRDNVLENALYAIGKIEPDPQNDTYNNFTKQQIYYLKIVLECFGFESIMDRKSSKKMDHQTYKKLEMTGFLERKKHNAILLLFNRKIKNIKPTHKKSTEPTTENENKKNTNKNNDNENEDKISNKNEEITDDENNSANNSDEEGNVNNNPQKPKKKLIDNNDYPKLKCYTKIINVILSSFGIKLDNTVKIYIKKGIRYREYTYFLVDNNYKFTEIVNRYNKN